MVVEMQVKGCCLNAPVSDGTASLNEEQQWYLQVQELVANGASCPSFLELRSSFDCRVDGLLVLRSSTNGKQHKKLSFSWKVGEVKKRLVFLRLVDQVQHSFHIIALRDSTAEWFVCLRAMQGQVMCIYISVGFFLNS